MAQRRYDAVFIAPLWRDVFDRKLRVERVLLSLTKEIDCSTAMAQVRELLSRQPLGPDSSATKEEISA